MTGDEEARDDEEDVDADEASGHRPGEEVVDDHEPHSDGAQALDVGPEGRRSGGRTRIGGPPCRADGERLQTAEAPSCGRLDSTVPALARRLVCRVRALRARAVADCRRAYGRGAGDCGVGRTSEAGVVNESPVELPVGAEVSGSTAEGRSRAELTMARK